MEDLTELLNIGSWKTGLAIRKSLSCGNICDDMFYSPEAGKAMILRDRPEAAQAENSFKNVSSCSSWEIGSQHDPAEDLARTVNQQCRQLFPDFNDLTGCSGFSASTPKHQFTTSVLPKIKGTILKPSVEDNPAGSARRNSSLWPILLYGTAASNDLNVPIIVGTAKKQNNFISSASNDKDSFNGYYSSKENSSCKSIDFRSSEDTTLRISTKSKAQSLNEISEQWIVQPQALTLDVSGKGRLLLVNKSSNRNLKFKIVFDVKLINVSPQSGILRSKSQIGLRVIACRSGVFCCVSGASRCANEEVIEDIIRITCGNIEKRIPVTICRVRKEKSVKDRSFKCF